MRRGGSYAVSITNRFFPSVTTSGSSVAIIIATDRENDPMVFSLDLSVQDLLHIDNTGNLTLQNKLDREVSWKMTITFPKCARNREMAVHQRET